MKQLADRPDMIGDPDRHRRGDPQGFMNSAQVKMRDIEARRSDMVRQLL